jgi:polysaccharide biosynthesis transport protein
MELKHYLAILRRWGWIMLLCAILSSVASYWFTSGQSRVYESRARYLVGPAIDNPNVTSNDLRASSQVGQTYAELATSRPIIQSVVDKLKLNIDADTVASGVAVTWIDTTQILNIRVRASKPDVAATIANTIGDTLIERSPNGPSSPQALQRQEANDELDKLQQTIRGLEVEIDLLASQVQQVTDPVAQRAVVVRLDQRRAQLAASQRAFSDLIQIVQSSNTNKITLVETAVPNDTPIAPDVQRNVLAALIAGLVLGLAAMLLFEYFTDMVYTPEELRKATGLAYLGGIARHKWLRGPKSSQLIMLSRPDTLAAESYRILRTNLQMAYTDQHLPSLLITSPSRGDGKSEIAANLAIAFAQSEKQVILIDANLRRPRVAALFGLPEDVGLSSLLDTPTKTLEPIAVEAVPGLSVVPAGTPTSNSSEILGSRRMYRLIQEYKARADIVILDSPPLLYSDALALAPQVEGVLLVVNSGATGRENTINAVEGLRMIGARVIGAVLNRVKPEPAYSYYPSRARRRMLPAVASSASLLDGPVAMREERGALASPGTFTTDLAPIGDLKENSTRTTLVLDQTIPAPADEMDETLDAERDTVDPEMSMPDGSSASYVNGALSRNDSFRTRRMRGKDRS